MEVQDNGFCGRSFRVVGRVPDNDSSLEIRSDMNEETERLEIKEKIREELGR